MTDELSGRERVLEGLGRDLMRGLNSVKRITQEQQLEDKVCGRGMQLMRVAVWWPEHRRGQRLMCHLQLTHAPLCCARTGVWHADRAV